MSEPTLTDGTRHWEFCCEWYGVPEIQDCIRRSLSSRMEIRGENYMPSDVASTEFAEWITLQYRLAMRKGMELVDQEMSCRVAELTARLAEATGLLKRLLEWDHFDAAGDGAYWRKEITELLKQGADHDDAE